MFTMKKSATSCSTSDEDLSGSKKRMVLFTTYQKWRTELDRDYKTITWLECKHCWSWERKSLTSCCVSLCKQFKNSISSTRNFSDKWIDGADSIRTSNIKDHAQSQQHVNAMQLFSREHAKEKSLSIHSLIIDSLHTLSDEDREALKKKFDIAYFIATEKLPLAKYPRLCELEKRHAIHLGHLYLNENSYKEFISYIASQKQELLLDKISKSNFFSVLLQIRLTLTMKPCLFLGSTIMLQMKKFTLEWNFYYSLSVLIVTVCIIVC